MGKIYLTKVEILPPSETMVYGAIAIYKSDSGHEYTIKAARAREGFETVEYFSLAGDCRDRVTGEWYPDGIPPFNKPMRKDLFRAAHIILLHPDTIADIINDLLEEAQKTIMPTNH